MSRAAESPASRWTFGKPWVVYTALSALILLLAANAVAGYRNATRLAADADWVEHTQQVMAAVDALRSAMKDAESGQRGFIITGDRAYLEPFESSAPRIDGLIDEIARLTVDNPRQQALVPRVRARAKARLSVLREGIAARGAGGFEAGRDLIVSGRGKQEMEALDALTLTMRAEEQVLLGARAGATRRGFLRNLSLFIVPSAAAVLLLLIVILQLRRFVRARADAAAALANERELLATTLSSIGDGVISTDSEARVTFLNPVAEELTEWTSLEAQGTALPEVFRIVNETSREPVENPALRALRDGVIVGLANHTILIGKAGTERAIDDSAAPIAGADGETRGAVLVFRDISERRAADRELHEANEEIKRLLDQERTRSERLSRVTAAGSTLLSSLTRDSVVGVVEKEARSIIGTAHAKVYDPDARQPGTEELAVPLPGRGGRPLGVLLLSEKERGRFDEEDHSILKQLAQLAAIALENARLYDELREGDRRKDEFLATLAHELRNPLAPIRNAVEIIRLAPGDENAVAQALLTMSRQTSHLVRLVDDLLDLSRISQGKIVLARGPVMLAPLIADALETSRSVIDAGGHVLHVAVPKEPIVFEADGTRLIQVISNLINNASKYMARGGNIHITAAAAESVLTISVRDEGIGIAPEMLERIFDLFVQLEDVRAMSVGGLGVGLTLVRRIVEMHGGTIQARSAGSNQGSEFVIRIPRIDSAERARVDASAARTGPAEPPAPRARKILVVDDNVDSLETMSLLLGKLGHEVRSGADGLEAVALAEAFRPDLILLDIGLPGINGYEAALRIRALLGKAVTIAAMTGWGQAEDVRRSLEAGFDRHLVKPIDLEQLQTLLKGS